VRKDSYEDSAMSRVLTQYKAGHKRVVQPSCDDKSHPLCARCRAILSKVLKALWVEEAERPSIESLLDAPGEEGEDAFGGSVQRFFRLKDNPRGRINYKSFPHADMGILTVAPRASSPALELVTPMGSTSRPEENLKDSECVVFGGEKRSEERGSKEEKRSKEVREPQV
jgi:hypothetical protein